MPSRPAPLRKELLVYLAVLFAVAMALAVLGLLLLLPYLTRAADATLFLAALIAADLAVLFAAGSYVLREKLVTPVERMVEDVRRMAEGGSHRVGPLPSAELQAIGESVNALADRLMRDQALLADNVKSLDRTNAELLEARGQVIRSARLASVGTLAAGIAHEVGNPLGAILGYVDVARSRALKDGHDVSLLEAVRDEARRIDRIVRNLLDYARPRDAGEAPVPARAVLERVRELLSARGKLDGVEHAWRIEDPLPDLLVEPSRMEQVLVNLLLNALDAVGPDGGRIEVSASRERGARGVVPARRDDDPRGVDYRHRRRAQADATRGGASTPFDAPQWVVLRIADNGPGIPEEDLERVFDPFFTTKPLGVGTGLGLTICARLVESMGGRIDVANGPGGGAVFSVRVPADAGAKSDAAEPAAATSTLSGRGAR